MRSAPGRRAPRPASTFCRWSAVLAALAAATTASAACDATAINPTFTVRDSAGIRIVESAAPMWGGDEEGRWRLGEAPLLEIGVLEGEAPYQFSRIVGAHRLSDGRIAVADRLASEIRFFDPQGRFLEAYGRRGSGPGEFENLGWTAPFPGDSLAAWDGAQARLSIVDLEEGGIRTGRIEVSPIQGAAENGSLWISVPGGVSGLFGDGTLLVTPPLMFLAEPGSVVRPDIVLLRYSSEGELLDTLGRFPGPELRVPTPGVAGRPQVPFGRPFVTALGDSVLYYGPAETYEIQVFASDGSLQRILRAFHRDLTLSGEAREAYRQTRREGVADQANAAEVERELRELEFPATLPAYSRMLRDAEGHLWVMDYERPGQERPPVWSVFDPAGQLLATVETPERLHVRQIGTDFVLGVWTDELDVPSVRLYPLER